jgi:hypothetical protein
MDNLFKPPCPYCDSKHCTVDTSTLGNRMRYGAVLSLLMLGVGSITIFMTCEDCQKAFTSQKGRSFK